MSRLVIAASIAGLSAIGLVSAGHAQTPEQQFAAAYEKFWVFAKSGNCRPGTDLMACVRRSGYEFSATSPRSCELAIEEKTPLPSNMPKTWDGKVAGKAVIARSLTVQLSGLDPQTIEKLDQDRFVLFFEVKNGDEQKRRVAMSTDPNIWIVLPPPPSISGLDASQMTAESIDRVIKARAAWEQNLLANYGKVDLPYFSIGGYFTARASNSPEGMQHIRSRRGRAYLMLETPSVAQAMLQGRAMPIGAGQAAIESFMAAIKSVLAKCTKAQ